MATRRPKRISRTVLTKGKRLEFAGLPELTANVDKLLAATQAKEGKQTAKEIKRLLMGAALVIRDEARDLAPYDQTRKSGHHLRDAIFAAYGENTKPDVLVGVNFKMAPHAHLVEFGHGGKTAAPHPYMRPAIATTRPKVAAIIAEGLKDLIEETLPE